jgi:hypothetical protein
MALVIHCIVSVILNHSMELLQKLQSFVCLKHMPPTKQSALTNIIKVANIQQENKAMTTEIPMDVVTRRNSTFEMLRSALDIFDHIGAEETKNLGFTMQILIYFLNSVTCLNISLSSQRCCVPEHLSPLANYFLYTTPFSTCLKRHLH